MVEKEEDPSYMFKSKFDNCLCCLLCTGFLALTCLVFVSASAIHDGGHKGGKEGLDFYFIFVSLVILFVVGFNIRKYGQRRSVKKRQEKQFLKMHQKAEEDLLSGIHKSAQSGDKPRIEIARGSFLARYTDSTRRGGQLAATGTLNFNPHPDTIEEVDLARQLNGNGSDGGGAFVILQGKVNLCSGKAYWIQQHKRGPPALVYGNFAWDNNHNKLKFLDGEFVRRDGGVGEYQDFVITPLAVSAEIV